MFKHDWRRCIPSHAGVWRILPFAPMALAALWLLAIGAADAAAQLPVPQADPRDFGLVVPDAPAKPGDSRRVLVASQGPEPVVAQVQLEIGDRLVVLLPDGRLESALSRETTATERPFVGMTKSDLAKELTSRQFRGFKTRETNHYLYIYDTSEEFFRGTSRILETMYPKLVDYCRRRKIEVHEPQVPLVMIMFRTQREFDAYHSMPDGVVAYYSTVTNFVVMHEQSSLGEMAPELAVKQAISTVAHEGVHQILHNIGVQRRLSSWPMWITEGLPEYFAPTTVDSRVRWKGVGLPNDLRMKDLETYLKQPASGPPGEMIRQTISASRLSATGYAAAWALTHFLAERRRDPFRAFLAEVALRDPLVEYSDAQNVALFEKHFGGDFAGLEQGLIQHLKSLPYVDPIANQTHYVMMLELNNGALVRRQAGVTSSPAAAKQWQQQELGSVPANLRPAARFSIQAFPTRDAARHFADSWLSGQ